MRSPPTGTVTFLFTDIEGSTRMWERDEEVMRGALARHDEILAHAIESNGGFVFKTVGDAFCASFADAADALEAALAAQRALLAEPWRGDLAIRARMALHTGSVRERDGDYFGPPVNRVARLLSAGHGGQTLLSLATQELARDALPAGAGLEDLGERRLKDLFRPERVFQLSVPDLPDEFPPLRTLDAARNNLPVQPTPLVGREREAEEVCERLRQGEVRLLTLTGPGGTGKTRLALQSAADMLEEFADGTFLVALETVTDPDLFVSTVAGVFGLSEGADASLFEVLREYLARRELLLVLDNFEQILGAAPLVGELLAAAPDLKVLATSRIPLGLYGEHEYAVPPLSVPDPKELPPIEVLSQYEAVRLFIEQAGAAKRDFEITAENAPAVAEICVRLDGLPLAIELAAARVKMLPPVALLARLSNRLKLLTGGARDLPERQRTLRGAIEWSHDLLDEGEKILFARLAVFSGGRTLEAIEAVCDAGGDLPVDSFEGVSSLLDKSLIRQEEGPGDEPRFVMLETIHEFAREKLEESGEAQETKRRHAGYFLTMAEEAEPELLGPDQVAWMDRLEAEHDNLRAALSWCMETGEAGTALRMAGALGWFWSVRSYFSEGRGWSEEALARTSEAPSPERAKALQGAGNMAFRQGDYENGEKRLEESLAAYGELGDRKGEARSLNLLGESFIDLNDFERASDLVAESVDIVRGLEDKSDLAYMLNNAGALELYRGNAERARLALEEALGQSRATGQLWALASGTVNLALTAMVDGDYEEAHTLMEEGLELLRPLKDRQSYALGVHNLGLLMLLKGNPERAADLCAQSVETAVDLLDPLGVASDLDVLGAVAGEQGDMPRAARLWGAAEALRDAIGVPQPGDEAAVLGPLVEASRSRLERTAWDAAWTAGAAMSQDEAVAYALRGDQDPTANP